MRMLQAAIIAVLVFLTQATPAFAGAVCSEGMIQDSYGYVGQSVVDTGQGILYCAVTGVFKFRADGTAKGNVKQSCNGMLEKASGVGTYVVRPSCLADANIEFSDGTSALFHFTVTDGGKTLMFVGEQMGITFSGTARPL
jgi:hypothetical protein